MPVEALTNQIRTVVAYTNTERIVQGFYFARAEGFDTQGFDESGFEL
jgi:hypothetical protein